MALFAYRAVDADGRISTGNLDAANAIDLELRLKRLGLDLLTFEGVKRNTAARTGSTRSCAASAVANRGDATSASRTLYVMVPGARLGFDEAQGYP